jgi:putative tryptophan/tyrosine transport system substrate-binding protein
MRRRDFILVFGGVASASTVLSLSARAQHAMPRIGILMGTAESDVDQHSLVSTFVRQLADLGWRDGENIHIEYRWAAGDPDRMPKLATELARLNLDAILAQGTPATAALRRSAPTTPVVFVNVADPVSSGLVSSLAHPGGVITGFSNYEQAISGKWLELLKEAAPGVARVAVLFNPDNPGLGGSVRALKTAAAVFGMTVIEAPARDAAVIERLIDDFGTDADNGLLVFGDFLMMANRDLIVRLAANHRLAALYSLRQFTAVGGLMSYSTDSNDLFLRAASYIDRILRGAKPADLPVQQPIKFELVINMRTAKSLGLVIPQSLLATADEVIE